MFDNMRLLCVMLGGLTTFLILATIAGIHGGNPGDVAIGSVISTILAIACLKACDDRVGL